MIEIVELAHDLDDWLMNLNAEKHKMTELEYVNAIEKRHNKTVRAIGAMGTKYERLVLGQDV